MKYVPVCLLNVNLKCFDCGKSQEHCEAHFKWLSGRVAWGTVAVSYEHQLLTLCEECYTFSHFVKHNNSRVRDFLMTYPTLSDLKKHLAKSNKP